MFKNAWFRYSSELRIQSQSLQNEAYILLESLQLDWFTLVKVRPRPSLPPSKVSQISPYLTITLALPPAALSIPAEQVDTLVADLKAELAAHGAGYPLRVVWGRNPL